MLLLLFTVTPFWASAEEPSEDRIQRLEDPLDLLMIELKQSTSAGQNAEAFLFLNYVRALLIIRRYKRRLRLVVFKPIQDSGAPSRAEG
jgi:hypothetical protein